MGFSMEQPQNYMAYLWNVRSQGCCFLSHQKLYLTLFFWLFSSSHVQGSWSKTLVLIRKPRLHTGMACVDFSQPEIRLVHLRKKKQKNKRTKNKKTSQVITRFNCLLWVDLHGSCHVLYLSHHTYSVGLPPAVWSASGLTLAISNRKSDYTSSHAPVTSAITCIMHLKINMLCA